jgi:3-hydroxyacyl-[acyl-carrier-protein] dehydratase
MALLNKDEIKNIIPHREPFLLIDEITALEPGKTCTAVKYINAEDFWFKGHFPGMPVTPGVLMVEMLAQTGAVCVGSLPENKGKVGLFAKIEDCKFRRMVVPGDTLTLEVEIIKLRSSVGVAKGVAHVGGEKAVTAEITFAFSEAKNV